MLSRSMTGGTDCRMLWVIDSCICMLDEQRASSYAAIAAQVPYLPPDLYQCQEAVRPAAGS